VKRNFFSFPSSWLPIEKTKGRGEIAVNCQVENIERELLGVRARQGLMLVWKDSACIPFGSEAR
jgi:hypothetical protein